MCVGARSHMRVCMRACTCVALVVAFTKGMCVRVCVYMHDVSCCAQTRYALVCVCVCVRACVRVCVCVCMCKTLVAAFKKGMRNSSLSTHK